MKLSSFFVQGNSGYMEGAGREMTPGALEQNLKNGMKEIAGKTPGQTVTGEVIERNGNDVLIAIGKDQFLRARLDSSLMIELGQQMTFSIKNMAGSRVVLSPLFTNTGNDPNISKALQMAGLPENESTVKMVRAMMEQGMSIDKGSLHNMMRLSALFPRADVETLIQLTKLGMPVTEDNIFQLEAYKNYEHQMSQGLMNIADAIPKTLHGMILQGDIDGGIALFKEVLSLLTGQDAAGSVEAETEGTVPIAGQQSASAESGQVSGTLAEGMLPEEELQSRQEVPGFVKWNQVLTQQELSNLTEQLNKAGMPKEQIEGFVTGKNSVSDLMKQLNDLLMKESLSEAVKPDIARLLEGGEFNKLLKNEMTGKLLLSPEEVGQEHKVEEFYQRLDKQMNRLNQVLEQAVKGNTPLARAVSTVSGNIDFMNQLNQTFTYIQLPLKMQGKDANGELYVYTNKKNLAEKDGEISALLHLDMEHLGSVDVHVSLKETKVATQFFLKDDSALDLIAEHIDLLSKRLERRGYSMSASFIKREEEDSENIMEEILKQEKNISVLSGYSFDARA